MPDYQHSKIYKIWSPSKNLVYYGSTVQTISQRLTDHLTKYKTNNRGNCSSCLVLDCEDYRIELVEYYPCNNKQQLLKKEGEYIKNNKCVNERIAGRTPKEYKKEHAQHGIEYRKNYRENHKEELKEKNKIYSKENKEIINLKQRRYTQTKKQNNLIYKWLLMTGIVT
jgi:hypothetical protein